MKQLLYMIFYIAGTLSALFVGCFGIFFWQKSVWGLRLLTILIWIGVIIDVYGLVLIALGINAPSRLPLYLNDAAQLVFTMLILMHIGKDVLSQRLYAIFFVIELVCFVGFVYVLGVVPEWLQHPYISSAGYLLIVICSVETAIQFQQHRQLDSTQPEAWLLFGVVLYAAGIDVLLLQRSVLPTFNPSLFWIGHAPLAMVKNWCFYQAFKRN
jgi:hypothetical protein